MSKYVRTKDGRIIDTTKIATGSKYMDFATNDESFRAIFETEPLSKADTIEELVDIYIADSKYSKNKILQKWNSNNVLIDWSTNKTYTLEELPKHFKNIRCGIFTNKGIIYVGDMNDEGDLKL